MKQTQKQILELKRRARIFFAAVMYGLPARFSYGKETLYEIKPYMEDTVLGFPTGRLVFDYVQRIGKQCPDLKQKYRKACRELKEARRRHSACKTTAKFNEYLFARNGLAHRTFIARKKTDPKKDFKTRLYKYMLYEILRACYELSDMVTSTDEAKTLSE